MENSDELNGTTTYVYDGWQVVEEHGVGGTKTYTYGNYIDEPVSMTNADGTFYYHSNNLYNVTALTDSNGDIVERYRYTAYGEPMILDDDGNERATSAYGNRYMFQGRRLDEETALYYYRNRYYWPELGRFLTRDPFLVTAMSQFAAGSPIVYTDPLGLKVEIPDEMEKKLKEVDEWIDEAGSLANALRQSMKAGDEKAINKWLDSLEWVTNNLKYPDSRAPAKWQNMTTDQMKTYMEVAANSGDAQRWVKLAGRYSPVFAIIAQKSVDSLVAALKGFANSRQCMKMYRQGLLLPVVCHPTKGDKAECCSKCKFIRKLGEHCAQDVSTSEGIPGGVAAWNVLIAVRKVADELADSCNQALDKMKKSAK